jgi:hypothetical protein
MPELPIVCTLSPDALRTRRQGLLAELLQQSSERELLPDGLRLRFAASAETLSSIAKAIEVERHWRRSRSPGALRSGRGCGGASRRSSWCSVSRAASAVRWRSRASIQR